MERSNIFCRFIVVTLVVMVVLISSQQRAYASAALCPGCYLQISGPTCILGYEDVSLCGGCIAISAAHAATMSALQAFFAGALGVPQMIAAVAGAPPAVISPGAFGTHAWFIQQDFMVNGLIAALQGMSKQITVTHQKQAEIMATIVTSEMQDDTKRTLQRIAAEAMAASLPSEAVCEMGSMTGGLISAESEAQSLTSQWQRVLMSNALGDEGAATNDTRSESERARLLTMCQYAPQDLANGSLDAACQGVAPATDDNAAKFILARNLHEYSLDNSYMESINLAMAAMFIDNQPENVEGRLFENDAVKIAYMDHRSVLARQMLETYCFRKTFEDRQGGSSSAVVYQDAVLSRMGLSVEEINNRLGPNPSAYAQKKLMIDMVSDPKLALDMSDSVENILGLVSGIQSIKMATLYDTLEILHCNELVLSQVLNHKLKPVAADLQERIDVLDARIQQDNGVADYAQGSGVLTDRVGGI